jgi:hypothetical protein
MVFRQKLSLNKAGGYTICPKKQSVKKALKFFHGILNESGKQTNALASCHSLDR